MFSSYLVYLVFKLKLMYKVNMMVKSKRLVVVLLVMMGVLFGCGEDD